MTLAEAAEIFAYWECDPPTHLMLQTIARMLGWTPRPTSPATMRIEDIAAAAPPGLILARSGSIGMPMPVFDTDALRARNRARAAEIARRSRPPA
jgi:hypothetical protein